MNFFIDSDAAFEDLSEFEKRAIRLIEYSYTQKSSQVAARIAQAMINSAHEWIKTGSLYEASVQLLALTLYDSSLLNGSLLGQFANRLIQSEVQKGGPYRDKHGTVDIKTNIAIAQLFMQLNTPLASLNKYLETESKNITKHINRETRWIFLWPNRIISDEQAIYIKRSLMPFEIKIVSLAAIPIKTPPLPVSSVMTKIKHELRLLPTAMQGHAKRTIDAVISADKYGEIQLLCSSFVVSLINKDTTIDATDLDTATIYAWIAYTLYDNCIDGDSSPDTIPVANFYHRKSLMGYLSFCNSEQARATTKSYFNAIDYANAWEISNCRMSATHEYFTLSKIPDYQSKEILFHRACAHALGPLLLTAAINTVSKQQYRHLASFFKHYLIARQINDDLHDWKNDIKDGHCSYVVSFILRKTGLKPGVHSFKAVIPLFESYLWRSGFRQLLKIQEMHSEKALRYLEKSSLLEIDSPFQAITIDPIIASIHKARQKVKNEKDFLKTFTQKVW